MSVLMEQLHSNQLDLNRLSLEQEETVKALMMRAEVEIFEAMPASSKWFRDPKDRNLYLKFLRSRKFDVSAAITMMKGYVEIHETIPNWSFDFIRDYVSSGVSLADPNARDKEGRAIVWLFAGKQPKKYLTNWQVRVVTAFHEMEHYLDNYPEVQRNGFTLVVDLKDVPYVLDKDAKLFFDAVQNKLPALVRAVYIINIPWFFKFLFNFFWIFLSHKIRERVKVISEEHLVEYVDPIFIPETHKYGKSKFTVEDWIRSNDPALKSKSKRTISRRTL